MGLAIEAGTDLGLVTTICGFALKIVLYIYIQTVLTHHTHTHTNSRGQVAAQQSRSIWKALSTDTTPASEGCLHSFYLGEQRHKKAFHLHPFLRNKELESVCHETDIPFVLLRAMQRMLI